MAEENKNVLPQGDHDLLVSLSTTVGHMRDDLKEIKDTAKDEVADLKRDKLDSSAFEAWKRDSYAPLEQSIAKIDKQTSSNSRYIWIAIGALLVIQIVIQGAFAAGIHSGCSSNCSVSVSPQAAVAGTASNGQ